jgi:uncharacterized membrane protein
VPIVLNKSKQLMNMTDAEYVTVKILRLLNIKFNKAFVINSIKAKVNFPSLASVNETFKDLYLDTVSYRANVDDLGSVSYPVVSQITVPANGFVVLENYNDVDNTITYYTANDRVVTEPVNDFKVKWSGVVLELEKNSTSGERHYYRHKLSHYKTHLFILAISILFLAGCQKLIATGTPVLFQTIMVLNFMALAVAWLIFIKESLPGADILDKICKINRIFDCQKVLNSGVGNMFSLTNLAEIAALYFTFTSFLLLSVVASLSDMGGTLTLLLVLTIVGLPVNLYSLYKQVFKIKAFCVFCLTIIAVYVIQAVLLLFNNKLLIHSFDHLLSPGLFFALGLTGLVKMMSDELKVMWEKKSNSSEKMKKWFTGIPGMFKLIVDSQTKVIKALQAPGFFELGNNQSDNVITYVINPNCLHCKSLASEMDQLLFSGSQTARLKLIFLTEKEISSFLISISLVYGAEAGWKAYLLYAKEGIGSLYRTYNISNENIQEAESVYYEHADWCRQLKISTTPKIFINGAMVPDMLLDSDNLVRQMETLFVPN